MKTLLEVKNLKKNYGNVEAVSDVSFEVKKGEIFALIGPNGAGKSTTLKVVAGLLSPSGGKITIDNFDVASEMQKIREIITYLPEDSGAYKNLSGFGYLRFMAGLYSKDPAEEEKFFKKAVEISGLGEKLRDKAGTYSKGMVRKLLLARAVMSNPRLIILDEPTSGLDVLNAIAIRKIIRNMAESGTSVLLSSHNMLEIEYLSDRVAIIDKGKIFVTGTSSGLKKKYNSKNLEEVFEKVVAETERVK